MSRLSLRIADESKLGDISRIKGQSGTGQSQKANDVTKFCLKSRQQVYGLSGIKRYQSGKVKIVVKLIINYPAQRKAK